MSATQAGTGVEVTMNMSRVNLSSPMGKTWLAFQYACAARARTQSSARVVGVKKASLSVSGPISLLDLLSSPSLVLPIAL
jgi:hypothetical protein